MFPHIKLLSVLYMDLNILKYINHIIKCDIVLYSYFPSVMSVHILYIHLQILKYIYIYIYMKNVRVKTFSEQFTICIVKTVVALKMSLTSSRFLISCIIFNKTCSTCVKPAVIQ